MKIKAREFYENKTRKYLMPIFIVYEKEFRELLTKLFKVGIGIGDLILERSNIIFDQHLFILIDINSTFESGNNYYSIIEEVKKHPSFEYDYKYGLKENFHMLVFRIPDEFKQALEKFKQSKYSEMYTKEQLSKLFQGKKTIDVLLKTKERKDEFRVLIQNKFKMNINDIHPDALEGELEFPIKQEEEYFNFNLVGE